MNVAIIPARGGSKRIPRKNIKVFCGKPMIAYSIEAALASGCFEKVVVSTDDSEIAALAREYGASVPFLRPGALSDDYTGTVPVIRHAIEQLSAEGKVPAYVCCIYATAPFVNAADIKRGFALMADAAVDYAFSVASYPFPIQRAVRVTAQNRIEMFQPEHLGTRSQDLEEAFHDAGQFYWGRTSAWLEGRPIFGPCSVPVVMPRHRVQDIDTLEDWIRAEWLFKAMQAGN
ncbi:pseudaminic acid cytidylyltransferase [Pseudomonas mosselii]|uniref:pseudaminic acid cytidylyltransferase n=1 Tax=Pseudomonas mosselii TaxID=78327 RepID=UPI0016450148|nr:pseudaminic acid cytidylyltransferase [Pseudomonas mosselii]MBC3457525.1 pseudaminic acid cytidylyltransferase [Pseudomonas mosselii]MDH1528574.1 pseudaminic acid cytidylyltransferase [Pseudomonas mosselii]